MFHKVFSLGKCSSIKTHFNIRFICSFIAKLPTVTDPNLNSLLKKCNSLPELKQIHGFIVVRGLDQDNLLVSKFIETCSLMSFRDYACSIFFYKSDPDLYLYNNMIRALSQSDSAQLSILLYNRIQYVGLRPDTYSFPFVLKAVAHLSLIKVGKQMHGQLLRMGLSSDMHVLTGLVHMYSNCKAIDDARKVFDEMSTRDIIVWNAMVTGYAKMGDMDNARQLFENMPERNVISWTAVVSGYAQANSPSDAINIFRMMQLDGVVPDEISMVSVLSACATLGALDLGEWIHNYIDKNGLKRTVPLSNALIDMYAKSGNISKAVELFEGMSHRSVITWSTMIAGLALHGLANEAFAMFSRMQRTKIEANEITFIALLSACSHVGSVEMGRWCFDLMKSSYQIKPTMEHYGCMVDILGRAGCLKEAQDLVREMPFEANAAIWGSLLAASRTYSDIDLGKIALWRLIELEPYNSGNYILLSNIYSSAGKWDEARDVRKMMRDRGVKKIPGGSCIEINGIVHEFTVGDCSHPQSHRIHEVLFDIYLKLNMHGYDPNVCIDFFDFDEKLPERIEVDKYGILSYA